MLWLFKVDASGECGENCWSQLIDGPTSKGAFRLARSASGTFGIIGYANPPKTESSSLLFVSTDASGDMLRETQLHPNSLGTGISATEDGGFIICGYTDPMGSAENDILLVKISADGGTVWQREIGGMHMDRARSVCPVRDGGYILTGATSSFGSGNPDLLILKTDANGEFEQ